MTTCKRCGTPHRLTNRTNGRRQQYCPACTATSTKRWRQTHRDTVNEYQRARYHAHTPAEREAHRDRAREWQRKATGYYERRGLTAPPTTRTRS
jgi:uncharacterized Zn finger protein (UPF0148 family)